MTKASLFPSRAVGIFLLIVLTGISANAAVTVIGVQYQQDELFPEYNCIWHDANYPSSCSGTYLGGNVHVYVKNTGGAPVTINDVTLAGYSLKTIIKLDPYGDGHDAQSLYYYWDIPPADITAAGIPVWYKGDPSSIPAGGVAQAVIRLRKPPTTPTVSVGVVTSGGTVVTNVPISPNPPQLASVGFSWDRTKVFLHWRRNGGAAPTTIKMDGVDVTANTTTGGDPSMNFAESVINLAAPLTYMSYHVFQGVYADGKTATASLRAWSHPFLYASWGTFPDVDQDTAHTQQWIDDATERGFNAAQNQVGGIAGYVDSAAGKAYCDARGGYGIIVWNKNTSNNPLMCFIDDEPDAEESNVHPNTCGVGLKLDCNVSPMGILGMLSVAVGEDYRAKYPLVPTTINMDGGYKPENYYVYGQLADVLQVDPYYQKRLKDTYWYHYPEWVPLYNKATYNYAVAKAATRAAEPNPFHVILLSTESKENVNGVVKTWPFPTPQAKRIEVFYSLAGGAKGISYWWFTACAGQCSNGLGDQSKPAAQALWKEMGMFGNEIKTVSELLVTSHPVDLPLTPSANVWARALAVGPDTMILLVVNDNYYNDEAGFHSTDVANATVTATMPAWMQPPLTAFEVTTGGLRSVSSTANGNQLQLNLGTLKLTRMIVLTKNPQLLPALQQRYDQLVRPGLCSFASEVCTNTPLAIAQHPTNQIAVSGSAANFTVVAFGTNLRYQWQTNNVNLVNGAHYSGCTNATLTIFNSAANDATSYRCVVTAATGTANSSYAALTVTTSAPGVPTAIPATSVTGAGFAANWSNPGGASGFRLDVSTNNTFSTYLAGYQNLDVGNQFTRIVTGLEEGKTYYYRVRAYNVYGTSGNSGTISVVTAVTPPPAPVVTPATSVTSSGFTANWNMAATATGYRLDVSTNSAFTNYVSGYQNLDVAEVVSWGVSGLSPGKTYYHRVRAYNSGGASTNSATVMVATVPAAPVANPATSVISSAFIANWSSVPGATGYRMDVSTNVGFSSFLDGFWDLDVGNALSRGVVELSPDTTYYYRVRAYNLSGMSGNSGTANVTLPVTTSNNCVLVLNPGFESGFSIAGAGYVGNNWNKWEIYPGIVVGYDETVIVHGGGHAQRIRIFGTNATAGGTYQRIPTVAGLPCSVSIWTYADTPLTSCYLGVDPAGGTNALAPGVTWTSANTNSAWVQKTWSGVATANYITAFLKVASPDTVKRNGYFDDAGPAVGPQSLTAQRHPDGLGFTLSWPECPNSQLERADGLNTPMNWSAVTNQVTASGGRKSVVITPAESTGFFRLHMQ